jgi:hypothetical protein
MGKGTVMRKLVLATVLAGLGSLPLGVSAQAGEEGTPSESNLREPAPSAEPAPEEPALQLKLDDAGVEVARTPPRTPDGYTLEEMNVRVKRAKIGLGISAGVYAVGGGLFMGYFYGCVVPLLGDPTNESATDSRCNALLGTGVTLGAVSLAGIITSGVLLARRKRARRELKQAHYGTLRRVQWDLARSALVF